MITEQTATALRDAGCVEVLLGIENINPIVLKSMRKNITREEIENACELLYKNCIQCDGYILFGDPEETEEIALENLAWWVQNRKYRLGLGVIAVLPNSKLYLSAKEQGIISDPVAFIKEPDISNTFINLTKMDDITRRQCYETIFHLLRTNGLFGGHVSQCTYKGKDMYGRDIFNFIAYCPHCGKKPAYNNVAFSSDNQGQYFDIGYSQIRCKYCNRVFDIPNIDIAYKYMDISSTYINFTHLTYNTLQKIYNKYYVEDTTSERHKAVVSLLERIKRYISVFLGRRHAG